jgi:hypothetical protein
MVVIDSNNFDFNENAVYCKWCGYEIIYKYKFSDKTGYRIPLNLDDTPHECCAFATIMTLHHKCHS